MAGRPRLLVGQSGGPTAVINSSLVGVVRAAVAAGVTDVYGARGGVEGILADDLVDLGRQPPGLLDNLRLTPAAALGSGRYKLRPDDSERIARRLRDLGVGYFVYIGGNDSADTSHRIACSAAEIGFDLRVIGVPKTIDNDLPVTDHSPGYGSIARFVATAVHDAGFDTEAMRRVDPIKLVEVQGRNAGWIAAATALAKRDDRDAPHLIFPPERPIRLDAVLAQVEAVQRRLGYCVAVVAETARDERGRPLGSDEAPADAFGHRRVAGAAQFLAERIAARLGVRARWDKPGTIARMSIAHVSPVDLAEAYRAGEAAVAAALAGESDRMVTLERADSEEYACAMGLAPLERIANGEKILPAHFLTEDGTMTTDAFRAYAAPLIGGPIPPYARLLDLPIGRPG